MTGSKSFSINLMLIICLLCFVFGNAEAQKKQGHYSGAKDTLLNKFVYNTAEKVAQPDGGMEALHLAIAKQLRYPPVEDDYLGKVVVAFVIEPNGKVDGKRTVKDPSGKKEIFSKQVLDIISSLKWKPAVCNGKAVPFLFVLPLQIEWKE